MQQNINLEMSNDDDIYLFLDVDGVFNGNYQINNDIFDFDKIHLYDLGLKEHRGDYISNYKFSVFRNLTKKYNVKIVGVSSVFNSNMTIDEIDNFAKVLDFNLVDIGYTTCGGLGRGDEVLRYVKDKNITKFIIVDDSGDRHYCKDKFKDYAHCCVFPMGRFGLTDYHFECLEVIIKNLLNGADEKPFTYTTKQCYNCGSKKMIEFSSLNYKECSVCETKVDWNLEEGQKPL